MLRNALSRCLFGADRVRVIAISRAASNVAVEKKTTKPNVKKSVYVSQSTDIFTNLALEDWIYKNLDFTENQVLMVWRNNPCVVIGRHQNPWVEANVPFLTEKGIPLARRNSGGGTVYHDRGNLNLSFFTTKEAYDRKYNLELITRALFREYSVHADINERQDIIIKQKYKISGTAAKLGRPSAYHHCTLLVNANRVNLSQALAKNELGISSKATASVRSPVMNLCEESSRVTVDGLQTAVGWEYLRTLAYELTDGGLDQISKQNGFQFVNPTEDWFPGITKIRDELSSWDWIYGKTPAFEVCKSFQVPSATLSSAGPEHFPSKEADSQELSIKMTVEKGLIENVSLNIPPGLIASGFHGDAPVITELKGKRFSSESATELQEALQNCGSNDKLDNSKKLNSKSHANVNKVLNTM